MFQSIVKLLSFKNRFKVNFVFLAVKNWGCKTLLMILCLKHLEKVSSNLTNQVLVCGKKLKLFHISLVLEVSLNAKFHSGPI